MIIYVDIDETICYYDGLRYYPNAKPNHERIEKINRLFDEGNIIVYWTSRGSVTEIDWLDLTKQQLAEWGCKHHGVKAGKPQYDLFIDNKNINSETFFKDFS